MTRKSFKRFMNTLMQFEDCIDAADYPDFNVSECENILDGYISLLETILELPRDANGDTLILDFLYWYDRGQSPAAWFEDCYGNRHYMRNLDELWDCIMWIRINREEEIEEGIYE